MKDNVKKLSKMQHRDAKIGTSIKRFRDMENKDQSFNIHLIRGPEGEELINRGATIFKKRMTGKLLQVMKKNQFLGSKSLINPKQHNKNKHILIQMIGIRQNTRDEGLLFKEARENRQMADKYRNIILKADCSKQTLAAERQ